MVLSAEQTSGKEATCWEVVTTMALSNRNFVHGLQGRCDAASVGGTVS